MKIIFIVPDLSIGGGIRVVFEHANRLKAKGHEVLIIYPLWPLNFGKRPDYSIGVFFSYFRKFLGNIRRRNRVKWFDLEVKPKGVLSLNQKFIPNADIIVATAWPTAYYVYNYKINMGRKAYLIQSYEIIIGPAEKVDRTYTLDLNQIVIAPWLKELMERKFKKDKVFFVPNGVNFQHFYNDNKVFNKNKRVLMLYHSAEFKGVADGVKAFEIAREKYPGIKLVMFGTDPGNTIPDYAQFHRRPSLEELRNLYCSCDIFLCPSWIEGWHLPPMEAMACKCAVVATNVGGIPACTIAGKTALVSPPKEPDLLAENLIALLDNEVKLKEISFAGYNYIKDFTWESANDKLEKILKEIIGGRE
ncbi:MAG: glycosyltransferase family 4 protein [Candidatus Omnitrophica bacterium]|nr:glycosyltransferase family 4 protein [Candidatus Omnitrophota bacterium]